MVQDIKKRHAFLHAAFTSSAVSKFFQILLRDLFVFFKGLFIIPLNIEDATETHQEKVSSTAPG